MAVSVQILSHIDVLDMFGDADTSSAYSLSGNVAITIPPQRNFFDKCNRTTYIVVHSITFTLEGKCEIVTPRSGYSASRLCTITKELSGSEPLELSNEGHEDESCQWNAVFNVPVPGWLPPTSHLGYDDEFGVRYNMFAEIAYSVVDTTSRCSSTWSFWNMACLPLSTRMRTVSSERELEVRRFISSPTSAHPPCSQAFVAHALPLSKKSSSSFPESVSSNLRVVATVPEYISIDDSSFDVTIHLCAKDLVASDCPRIQVTEFNLDVTQIEKCRSQPSSEYVVRFPLPHESEQPPLVPLRKSHPMGTMLELGVYSGIVDSAPSTCSMSLLPADISGHYAIDEDRHLFANAEDTVSSYTIKASIPFAKRSERATRSRQDDWAGDRCLKPSTVMPLYGIRHELQVSVHCSYEYEDGSETDRWLHFSIPIRFGVEWPAPGQSPLASRPKNEPAPFPYSDDDFDKDTNETALLLPNHEIVSSSLPYKPCLPAYTELFHSNGDRRIDYSTPLPLYTPLRIFSDSESDAIAISANSFP